MWFMLRLGKTRLAELREMREGLLERVVERRDGRASLGMRESRFRIGGGRRDCWGILVSRDGGKRIGVAMIRCYGLRAVE